MLRPLRTFPRTLNTTTTTTAIQRPHIYPYITALHGKMATSTSAPPHAPDSSSAAAPAPAPPPGPRPQQPLHEWLVIVPDHEGALERRLEVRAAHLRELNKDPEGFWLLGGPLLEEPIVEGQTPKMNGSAMLIGARTKEEVVERLQRDVYVQGQVWDWEKVQIMPFKSMVRKGL